MSRRTVAIAKKNFPDRTARSFQAKVGGKAFQGFVVRQGDRYYAYRNMCQHLQTTLDLEDGEFFTHDKAHLQCQMHGALYEIDTGLCIDGPCVGARLIPLPLWEEETRLVIAIPDSLDEK